MTATDLAAKAFARRAIEVVNDGFLCLMIGIGHRTGLFTVLAALGPAKSEEIAARAGLSERYVREWLGAMVVGGIIEYEAEGTRYALPRHHARVLTSGPSGASIASLAQVVALLAEVEERVVAAFRSGEGIGYEAFPRLHEVMAEGGRSLAEAILEHILPAIPGLIDRLRSGLDVVDVACGLGHTVLRMAATFPASRFLGIDSSSSAIAQARTAATREGFSHACFEVRQAHAFADSSSFDLVMVLDAVHDLPNPLGVMRDIHASLRSGGIFLMADVGLSSRLESNIAHPFAQYLYSVSTMHCIPVSLAQGGPALGACWGEEAALRLLAESGFERIRVHRIPGDPMHAFYLCDR